MSAQLAVNQLALITTMVVGGAIAPRAFQNDDTPIIKPEIKLEKNT